MVKIFVILFLSLSTLFPSVLHAEAPKGLSITVGATNNFVFPSAFRVGWDEWEFGLLNTRTIGAGKLFFFSKSYYTLLGFGIVSETFGLTAGIGAWYEMFWGVALRAEISANTSFSGLLVEQGVLGISVNF
jgi:hypothetical protein